jgi:hypothetical protein
MNKTKYNGKSIMQELALGVGVKEVGYPVV